MFHHFQIVQNGLGGIQRTNDIMTNDLAKNRYFGFQPYINYLNYCFDVEIADFDDLYPYVMPEVQKNSFLLLFICHSPG